VLAAVTICWVLAIKKETTSALAWCLLVILLPILGIVFFVLFGYQHVHRPVARKARHRARFRETHPVVHPHREALPIEADTGWGGMARLAQRFDASPLTSGNLVDIYHDGQPAYDAKIEAIRSAQQHIHLEYFIFQPDESGRLFLEELIKKARQGVEVRLVYDAMGSHHLRRRFLQPLIDAGGKTTAFLPVDPLRKRIQVNLRNHRKILIVDGKVGFTGGLNIGDEYLGKVPRYGFWRDTHLRLQGPMVAALQRVFTEDWDFAYGEPLKGPAYYPPPPATEHPEAQVPLQVIYSGPDQPQNAIREIYFAAILRARRRLWIASPYFVPDAGIYDALRLAGNLGVDVRLLCLFRPDKWVPYFAARYYFGDVLQAGVKVYQYTKGMMHSKVILVDGEWASVGSANLDNRSLHLNFELNCLIYSPERVAELEELFVRDLDTAVRLEPDVFACRPVAGRLIENACRLLSPVL
jgi:cardiolipin synthase